MEHAVRADPGLQVREPFPLGRAEDGGHLPYRQDGGDHPQPDADGAQPFSRRIDSPRPKGITRSSAVLRIRHAASALPPDSSRASHTPFVPCVPHVPYVRPCRDPMRLAPPRLRDAGNPLFT
ncbi:hypothetical protein GCM10011579_018830 [Streptomyces albiflavescens]|uniref:Uncharacterized protein n=1 Tax=Streptomyces albiflavescens TaxID=1623582 RepID=A0A918D1C6_9ACTN|nr:hypothetical protein GCM10011579_018830 [Streptomyces albiflavescens]